MDKRALSALSERLSTVPQAASEMGCLHDEAGLRLNDMREIEVCAGCGIVIEGLAEQGVTEESHE